MSKFNQCTNQQLVFCIAIMLPAGADAILEHHRRAGEMACESIDSTQDGLFSVFAYGIYIVPWFTSELLALRCFKSCCKSCIFGSSELFEGEIKQIHVSRLILQDPRWLCLKHPPGHLGLVMLHYQLGDLAFVWHRRFLRYNEIHTVKVMGGDLGPIFVKKLCMCLNDVELFRFGGAFVWTS